MNQASERATRMMWSDVVDTEECEFQDGFAHTNDRASKSGENQKLEPPEPRKEIWTALKQTRQCKHFLKGSCRFGDKCGFSHLNTVNERPDLHKTRMCFKFEKGCCRKGDKCQFAHGLSELKLIDETQNATNIGQTNEYRANPSKPTKQQPTPKVGNCGESETEMAMILNQVTKSCRTHGTGEQLEGELESGPAEVKNDDMQNITNSAQTNKYQRKNSKLTIQQPTLNMGNCGESQTELAMILNQLKKPAGQSNVGKSFEESLSMLTKPATSKSVEAPLQVEIDNQEVYSNVAQHEYIPTDDEAEHVPQYSANISQCHQGKPSGRPSGRKARSRNENRPAMIQTKKIQVVGEQCFPASDMSFEQCFPVLSSAEEFATPKYYPGLKVASRVQTSTPPPEQDDATPRFSPNLKVGSHSRSSTPEPEQMVFGYGVHPAFVAKSKVHHEYIPTEPSRAEPPVAEECATPKYCPSLKLASRHHSSTPPPEQDDATPRFSPNLKMGSQSRSSTPEPEQMVFGYGVHPTFLAQSKPAKIQKNQVVELLADECGTPKYCPGLKRASRSRSSSPQPEQDDSTPRLSPNLKIGSYSRSSTPDHMVFGQGIHPAFLAQSQVGHGAW